MVKEKEDGPRPRDPPLLPTTRSSARWLFKASSVIVTSGGASSSVPGPVIYIRAPPPFRNDVENVT